MDVRDAARADGRRVGLRRQIDRLDVDDAARAAAAAAKHAARAAAADDEQLGPFARLVRREREGTVARKDVGAIRERLDDAVRRAGKRAPLVGIRARLGVAVEQDGPFVEPAGEHLGRRRFVVEADFVEIHRRVLAAVVERELEKTLSGDVPGAGVVEFLLVKPDGLLVVRAGDD